MKISQRTFLISGGSSGLGLATAQMLTSSGGLVVVLDRSPPSTSLTDDNLFKYIQCDVTSTSSTQQAIHQAVQWSKERDAPIGGIITCAGIARFSKIISSRGIPHDRGLWESVIDINVTGTFNLIRLALPHLLKVKPEGDDRERGIVVMVASVAAEEGVTGQAAYAASKGAIRSMVLPLARDLSRYGVRVVSIAPAGFNTPMTGGVNHIEAEEILNNSTLFPKRLGQADEFAQTIRWCLECPYVNGETIRLTGGGRVYAKL